MNTDAPAINPHAACQLLVQEMGMDTPLSDALSAAIHEVNDLRIARQWPMASSMSCFNPVVSHCDLGVLSLDLKPLRAFWEKGLTLVMKHDRYGGVSHMLACCKPLSELTGDHILSHIARVFMVLLPQMGLEDVDALIELAGRYDKLLRDAHHLALVPSENVLRDALFYLSLKQPDDFVQAWEWNDAGVTALQSRLRWVAKQLSQLLYPTEDTDKIDKVVIEKYLVPVTDALLFLNEIKLRTRLMLRMHKIDDRMLKIAVPVQMLMAEAIRLG